MEHGGYTSCDSKTSLTHVDEELWTRYDMPLPNSTGAFEGALSGRIHIRLVVWLLRTERGTPTLVGNNEQGQTVCYSV